jgi:hypothetical protein
MSDLRSLEKQLISEVGSLLGEHGFILKPGTQSYRCAKPFGWASIQLAFVKHPPTDFDVIVNASIRINAVQDVIQDRDNLISEKERKNSATVGAELGNLKGTGQQRWSISSEEDVGPAARAILVECEATLLPFIEKYSHPGVLLDALTTDGMTARLLSPFEEKRKKTVIALSNLTRS